MQKVEKFTPEINKVYFIERHTLIHILSGEGSIQVDFKNYFDWKEKAIFLEKGQYIKFLSDDFLVRRIEFGNEHKFYNNDVRVLFKHLISLGYIDFKECHDCAQFLSQSVFNSEISNIIDISTEQWYWQNPFQASKEEYRIIFDVKDIIDSEYANAIDGTKLTQAISSNDYNVQSLIKDKLVRKKLPFLTEALRKLLLKRGLKILHILIVFLKIL